MAAIFATSVVLVFHWWPEAHKAMSAERYTALCGERSECYPELLFAFGAIAAAFVALFSGFSLLLRAGRAFAGRS
jgi:O-antigen ligase